MFSLYVYFYVGLRSQHALKLMILRSVPFYFSEIYALPGANRQLIEDNKTPVMVSRVDCNGTEGMIKQCPEFSWGSNKCKLMEAASVTCVYQDNAAKKGE